MTEDNTDNLDVFEAQFFDGDTEEQPGQPEAQEPEEQPEGEANAEPEGEKDEGDKPKPKKTVSERIREKTAQAREAERKAEEAERRATELENRLKEVEAKIAPKAEAQTEAKGRPNPDDYPLGDIDPQFAEDLIDWKVEQRLSKVEAEAESKAQKRETEAQVSKLQETFLERVDAVGDQYPDFMEKVIDNKDWEPPETVALAIMQSEVGPQVAYHLATNPAETAKLQRLHPFEQARAIGRLEARFLAPQKTTSAPPPPENRTRGTGGKFVPSGDTDDLEAFESQFYRR